MAFRTAPETATFLPTPQGALAVHLHGSLDTRIVLIIVPPLFEERKGCHRSFAKIARALAGDHTSVLRFDFRGCGDSPGDFESFTLADWAADLRAAADCMRRQYPRAPQVWLGARLGALLALRQAAAAPQAERPAALMLWEPVDGPEFCRQLLQRRLVNDMLAYGQARVSRRAVTEDLAAGRTVDLDGFPLTARLHAALQLCLPCPWNGPGLIVTTGPDTRVADTCHTLAPAAERASLRLPPFWNTVGQVDTSALIQTSTAWIGRFAASGCGTLAPPGSAPASPEPSPQCGSATPWREEVPSELRADPLSSGLSAPSDLPGSPERLVSFAGRLGTLCGVLHLPPPDVPARGRVLFLHGWSGDRTGPHRMFVHAARALAPLGYACLRLDFAGRGDSEGDQASIATMTSDARAALAWLRAELPAGGPIALLAICSGSKVAIATAASEPDVARLALWSAESMGSLRAAATSGRKRSAMLRAYARKLLQPATWRKLLRGQVRAGMVGKALVQTEARSPEEARAEDLLLREFRRFRGDILFVFGGSDPDAPGSSEAYARFCRDHAIAHTRHTVPHAGHSYYGLDWEREVLDVTTAWLCRSAVKPRCTANPPVR